MQRISIPTKVPILNGNVAALVTFAALFNTAGIASGVKACTIKADATHPVLLEFFAEIKTAFNAGSGNILTVGTDASSANQILASGDITEGTPGFYPAANANVKLRVVADTDIYLKYAGGAGVAQVETATAAGNVTTAGNATVTVTSAVVTGSPLAISVALLTSDNTGSLIATKIRAALAANAAVAAKFTVSGATTAIILTAITPAANDGTLNIAMIDGTSVGVTTAATSANTTAGVAPATTGDALIYMDVTPLAPSPSGILA